MRAPWPENLRGLDRAIYQLRATLGSGGRVSTEALDGVMGSAPPREPNPQAPPEAASAAPKPPKPTAEELARALAEHGSVRATAKHYQRDRRQIYRWMEAYVLKES
jgi:DNA-binding NtrC family response regulator